jgi:hypothetical protein
MHVLDVLDQLDAAHVTLSVTGGRLIVDAPPDAITDDLATAVREHRDLIVAIVLGRATGHAPGVCSTCGELSMVHASRNPPTCRLTFGCEGRHQPRPVDLARVTRRKPPAEAEPPSKPSHKRYFGTWPTWPQARTA